MKNNVHQIDGKFYKECEVLMLPTDGIVSHYRMDEYLDYISLNKYHHPNSKNSLEIKRSMHHNNLENPQHLYILADDKIEGNDYVVANYKFNNISIEKVKSITDSGIFLNIGYDLMTNRCKKIISTTDKTLNLPRPSNEFIQAYVKANGIGFDKVLVEVEEIKTGDTENGYYFDRVIKLSPDNTITIKPLIPLKTTLYKFTWETNYGERVALVEATSSDVAKSLFEEGVLWDGFEVEEIKLEGKNKIISIEGGD